MPACEERPSSIRPKANRDAPALFVLLSLSSLSSLTGGEAQRLTERRWHLQLSTWLFPARQQKLHLVPGQYLLYLPGRRWCGRCCASQSAGFAHTFCTVCQSCGDFGTSPSGATGCTCNVRLPTRTLARVPNQCADGRHLSSRRRLHLRRALHRKRFVVHVSDRRRDGHSTSTTTTSSLRTKERAERDVISLNRGLQSSIFFVSLRKGGHCRLAVHARAFSFILLILN